MRERATQITPTPADEALCQWLTERYSGDEYATRIQVVQWVNNQRGEAVFTHDQKVDPADGKAKSAKPKLTRERLVEIANKIVAAGQADCDALRRATVYAVLAFHPAMGSDAYSRHLIRLAPKSALAVDADGVVAEDNVMSTKLLLGLLADEKRDKRWVMELAMNAVSGAAQRDAARITALEGIQTESWERHAKLIRATEEALNMSAEREAKREWNRLKAAGLQQGIATLATLVPGAVAAMTGGRAGVTEGLKGFASSLSAEQRMRLFGKWSDADTQIAPGILDPEQTRLFDSVVAGRVDLPRARDLLNSLRPDQVAAVREVLTQDQFAGLISFARAFEQGPPIYLTDGAGDAPDPDGAPSTAKTAEQRAIEKLFDACKAAGLDTKIFGDWRLGSDKRLENVAPGIIEPEQFYVLMRVFSGRQPASALDDLMPTSGKPVAITSEQQAQLIGIMPPGAQQALMELVALRQQAAAGGAA